MATEIPGQQGEFTQAGHALYTFSKELVGRKYDSDRLTDSYARLQHELLADSRLQTLHGHLLLLAYTSMCGFRAKIFKDSETYEFFKKARSKHILVLQLLTQNIPGYRDEGVEPMTLIESRETAVERNAWQRVLGTDVEIKPLPSIVTPEVKINLERLGFGIFYVPAINFGTPDELRLKGEEEFMKDLEKRYPNWRSYELLGSQDKNNHAISRNFKLDHYWHEIERGNIDFPRLPGRWLAVETSPKPSSFDATWTSMDLEISMRKPNMLFEIGLSGYLPMRVLEATEWNLLANREGWGKNGFEEWTNTRCRLPNGSDNDRLVVGGSTLGGAASSRPEPSTWHSPKIGSRLIIELGD